MLQVPQSVVPFIQSQMPSFYGTDGPLFVLFVESYYKWMAETFDRQVLANRDIDLTVDSFLVNFKNTYLPDITFDTVTNKRLLVKNIIDVYRSKGTTRGLSLFMKLIYGADATVYFPGDDVFRTSDASWTLPRFLEVTRSSRSASLVGKVIKGTVSGARCFVESFVERRTQTGIVDVLNVSNIEGQLVVGEAVYSDAVDDTSPRIVGSPLTGTIINGGVGFTKYQDLPFVGVAGNYGIARVIGVDATGAITKIKITESGIGFADGSTVYLQADGRTTGASMTVHNYAVGRLIGYTEGSTLGTAYLQDGDYWQEFSYDIHTSIPFDKYAESLKRVMHIAGKRAFGSFVAAGDLSSPVVVHESSVVLS